MTDESKILFTIINTEAFKMYYYIIGLTVLMMGWLFTKILEFDLSSSDLSFFWLPFSSLIILGLSSCFGFLVIDNRVKALIINAQILDKKNEEHIDKLKNDMGKKRYNIFICNTIHYVAFISAIILLLIWLYLYSFTFILN